MKKKNTISYDELSPQQLKKQKRKNIFSAVFDWMIIGTLVLGPTILTKSRPFAKKVDENLDLIEEISPCDNINMEYSNISKHHPMWNFLSNHLYSNHIIPFWAKKIDVNVDLNLSAEQKLAIQHSVDLLNELNQKTFTNVPPIVLNFGKDSISKFNIVDINVTEETDPNVPYEGVCESRSYPTLNGVNSLFSNIKIITGAINDTSNPTRVSVIFTHELLHALYGLDDNYNYTNDIQTVMNTENYTINDFLTPNDLYMINAICWNKELSKEQTQSVKEYYKFFEERYEKTDHKPIKNYLDGKKIDLTM